MQAEERKVTRLEPFSFLDRDAEKQGKRNQKIKEMEEEEKKQREFKAKPVMVVFVSFVVSALYKIGVRPTLVYIR